MADQLYTIGSLISTGSPSFQLDGVSSPSLDMGITMVMTRGAGQPDPSHVSNISIRPVHAFTTTELATLLTNVPAFGCFFFGTGGEATTLRAIYTQYQQGCTRVSGTNHFPVDFNQGMMVVRGISVAQDGTATAQVSIITNFDGTNVPVTFPAAVALPTISVDEEFGLGPVKIRGTTLDGVQRWEYDSGVDIYQRGNSGSVYSKKIGIAQRDPKFRVYLDDLTYARTVGVPGLAQNSSATEFYLRKKTKHGTYDSDASTTHIKLALSSSQGMINIREISGDDFTQLGLEITPSTGTNPAVVPTVGVAIS